MTNVEKAERILKDRHCDNVECNNCPGALAIGHNCNAEREDKNLPLKEHGGIDKKGALFFKSFLRESSQPKPVTAFEAGKMQNCRCSVSPQDAIKSAIERASMEAISHIKIFCDGGGIFPKTDKTIKTRAQRRHEILARLNIE